MSQAAVRPPTFVMFVNDAKLFNEPYRRFITRQLREQVQCCHSLYMRLQSGFYVFPRTVARIDVVLTSVGSCMSDIYLVCHEPEYLQ